MPFNDRQSPFVVLGSWFFDGYSVQETRTAHTSSFFLFVEIEATPRHFGTGHLAPGTTQFAPRTQKGPTHHAHLPWRHIGIDLQSPGL